MTWHGLDGAWLLCAVALVGIGWLIATLRSDDGR